MILTPADVTIIGKDLDHPEGLCVERDGTVYAGGEAGQLYRLNLEGEQEQVACTGGFLLGMALDGEGNVHVCDLKQRAVFRIDPQQGSVNLRSKGNGKRPFAVPNYPVFDREGNLYVSDSGDFWHDTGTGFVAVIRPDNTADIFHEGPFKFANGLAIDPSGHWLYVVQSSASNVVRIPLGQPNGPIEVTHVLPEHTVPDGLAFGEDGRLVIACYRPDMVYVGEPNGRVEVLFEDLTAELLMRPTNAALHDGRLILANVGGWHLAAIKTELSPAPLHRPVLMSEE